MTTCREYIGSLPVLAAAILHDVIEDTKYTEAISEDFCKAR